MPKKQLDRVKAMSLLFKAKDLLRLTHIFDVKSRSYQYCYQRLIKHGELMQTLKLAKEAGLRVKIMYYTRKIQQNAIEEPLLEEFLQTLQKHGIYLK